jgi:hypothetical protein
MSRIPFTSVTFTARCKRQERTIDLGTSEGARYFDVHHLLHVTPQGLVSVLAAFDADLRPHTFPQSTADLHRNIRERLAEFDRLEARQLEARRALKGAA